MPTATVVVQQSFTKAADQPALPNRLSLHQDAVSFFHAAPDGVAFTGCVHIPTAVVYLAPLKTDVARGNIEIGTSQTEDHRPGVGALATYTKAPEHLFHPNMSPQGRALAGETSGHFKLCAKYSLNMDECVGFAVSKSAGQNKLTTNSRTLNTEKFRTDHAEVARIKSPTLKAQMIRNLGSATKPSDGALSKEWAYKIAVVLEMAFTHCLKNPRGNFEAPF
jgi:hypothetical protein